MCRPTLAIASPAKQRAILNLLTALLSGSRFDLEHAAIEFDAVVIFEAASPSEQFPT